MRSCGLFLFLIEIIADGYFVLGVHQSDYPKAPTVTKVSTNQLSDSPITDSVFEEETGSLRRGSSQITVVDPYHPSLQQRSSICLGRRTSDSASSRKLSDAYPGFEDTLARKPSIVDISGTYFI